MELGPPLPGSVPSAVVSPDVGALPSSPHSLGSGLCSVGGAVSLLHCTLFLLTCGFLLCVCACDHADHAWAESPVLVAGSSWLLPALLLPTFEWHLTLWTISTPQNEVYIFRRLG